MRALPPIGWHSLLTQTDVSLGWSVAVALLLLGYLAALPRAQAAPGGFSAWRVTSYVAGVVLLWASICSSVGVYAHSVYYFHMVQHLLLITVVPALLVLGHPLTVLDRALGGGHGGGPVSRVLHSRPVALVTHPVVGFAIYAVVLVETHLTSFMNTVMASEGLVTGEHLVYLVAGYVYLLPLLGAEPIRWQPPLLMRLGLLVMGMIPDTVVGIVLLQTTGNPFPSMLSADHAWAPAPAADVEIGGGLMWVLGDGLMMVLGVGVVIALLSSSRRSVEASSPVGAWLEGVRRSTLQHHTGESGSTGFADDIDVDQDESALDAYNAMLRRMSGRSET